MRPHWACAVILLLGRTLDARAQTPLEPAGGPPAQPAPPAAEPPAAPQSVVSPAPTAPEAAPPSPTRVHLQPDAQTPPSELPRCANPGEPSEGAGMFFLGLGLFDFAELNRHLRANGYEPIDMPLTLIGGEGHAVLPNGFVMGARGGAILAGEGGGPDGMRRTLSGGFGMVDLGYALVRERPVLVTITTGLGGYGMELGIGDGQSVPFDQVLQNPRRSSSVSRGGVLVGLTLGVDGRVSTGPSKDGGHGFFTVGARIGGLYGPPLGSWGLSEGGDATGGPGPGLAGGFAAIAIGFGGGREPPPREVHGKAP